jgi:predicted phosphodiesterase
VLGILSDAHGNTGAFLLAISILRQLEINRYIFLGDAIGYIPDVGVVSALRSDTLDNECVRGNHEDMLLGGRDYRDKDDLYKLDLAKELLPKEDYDYIKSWPRFLNKVCNGLKVLYIHGSPDEVTYGYVYPDTSLESFRIPHDIVFMGNTHRPFVRHIAAKTFVNVGSCGFPRDDGRYGSMALFDPTTPSVRIVRFDISDATESTIGGLKNIHPAVLEVFSRRLPRCSLIGELL